MVLYGRVKRKKEFQLIFERKDARLLKFDVPVFAAESGANREWICDAQGILHYQSFNLLISPITGNLNPGFTDLFVIKADLAELKDKLVEDVNDYTGEKYYQLDFEVELVFDSINLEGNVLYNVCTPVPYLSYPTDQYISKGEKYGPHTTFELH